MPFTDADRERLVETHTTVMNLKEDHGRRLSDLEDEDDILHKRINSITRWFTGLLLTMNSAWGGLLTYLKLKG